MWSLEALSVERNESNNSANPAKNSGSDVVDNEFKIGGRGACKLTGRADFKPEAVSDIGGASVENEATGVNEDSRKRKTSCNRPGLGERTLGAAAKQG